VRAIQIEMMLKSKHYCCGAFHQLLGVVNCSQIASAAKKRFYRKKQVRWNSLEGASFKEFHSGPPVQKAIALAV